MNLETERTVLSFDAFTIQTKMNLWDRVVMCIDILFRKKATFHGLTMDFAPGYLKLHKRVIEQIYE